jgi:phosphopantetheinyl transferase
MNSSTKRGTEADVYIHDDGGHVLAQFNGISSRRISLDASWKDYVANPLPLYLSTEILELERTIHEAATAILPAGLIPEDDVTTAWCLDYVLHAAEQSYYQSLPNAQRRREWLSGRIVVKEAVRRLLARQGLFVCSADVLIEYAPSGQPIVQGRWQSLVPPVSISLTHKSERAAAVASFASAAGIDIEELAAKEPGFEKLAMLPHEVEFLNQYAGGVKQQLIIQMWSAKEAVGKALGTGMSADPRSLSTAPIGNTMERIQVTPAGGGTPYVVHSLIQDNFVLSCTLLEPVYSSLNA